jgi:hypothetical protein
MKLIHQLLFFTFALLCSASGRAQISFANVFADGNGNGVKDPGEASGTTDANGNVSLKGGSGAIVLSGGTDISTGLANKLVLKAPAGSTVVNPITSLIQSLVDSGSSLATATASIGNALGIDTTKVDLNTFDPVAVANNPNASAADRALAVSIQAANAKVGNILVAGSSTLVGAVGDSSKLNVTDAGKAVIASLAANLASSTGKADLSNSSFLKSVLNDSVSTADNTALDLAAGKVANAATSFGSTVGAISANIDVSVAANSGDPASALTKIAQAETVAQGQLATQLQSSTGSGNFTAVNNNFTGDTLTKTIDAVIPPPPPSSTSTSTSSGDTTAKNSIDTSINASPSH